MLKIGIFNGQSVKLKEVFSFEQIEKLLKLDTPLSADDASFLERASQRGDTVYVAINPYRSEIDNQKDIMYGLDIEKLKTAFWQLKDDI